jgi:hypothetical protein
LSSDDPIDPIESSQSYDTGRRPNPPLAPFRALTRTMRYWMILQRRKNRRLKNRKNQPPSSEGPREIDKLV